MDLKATFDVESWEEQPFAEGSDTAKLTQATVTRKFAGDITGTSDTVWVMAYTDENTATFVGIERITGSLDGMDGTLVLQHVGTYADGAAKAQLTVVEGAGTGDLADVTGGGELLADPSGKVTLRLA